LAAPGAWIWSALLTTDPDTDAAFYQALFGYDVFDLPGNSEAQHLILASGDYARASVNPLPPNKSALHPLWLNYLRVENTAASAAKVTALGGRVLVQPQIDRHGGQIAVVADPAGAVFGLMEWPDQAPTDGAK
jgi:predicted enzyme related to lactoylglutathione lyase